MGTVFTDYCNIGFLNIQFDLNTNSLNTYTKKRCRYIIIILGVPSVMNIIDTNGINIINILDIRYTKSEVDSSTSNIELNMLDTETEIQQIILIKVISPHVFTIKPQWML